PAARRADDRARPAGAPRRVGPAARAQARRRDAAADDALHGRGRAALRPPRRHGQGEDRGGGLAAGADSQVLDPGGRRAAVRHRPAAGRHRRSRRWLCATDRDTERPAAAVHRRRRPHRRPHPRARRAGTEHPRPALDARGRLPPSDGAQPRRRMSYALRSYEFWLTFYRRTWRGTVATSIVNPVFYLGAIGVGLGTLVNKSGTTPGGVNYLSFVAPGVLAATAMQIAATEASWPVLGAIRWTRVYYAMLATPLRIRDIVPGHQGWMMTRIVSSCAVYLAVIAAFGG